MGMGMGMAEAAVIIPHYNDVKRLDRCLSSLMLNDRTGVEIVVVDNGSTQCLAEVRKSHSAVRFIIESKKGAALARNRGVRETTAPLLFFVDADCVVAPDWLTVARGVISGADLIGGRIDIFDETPPPRSGAEAFETVFAFNNKDYIEKKGFSVTANLLTRRSVFDDVGEFVPGVSEDVEWCWRAARKGYDLVYVAELRVGHPTRSEWSGLRKKWVRITAESFGLRRKTPWGRLNWALRAMALPPSVIIHGVRIFWSNKLSGLHERLVAFGTLARLRLSRMVWMLRQAVSMDTDLK